MAQGDGANKDKGIVPLAGGHIIKRTVPMIMILNPKTRRHGDGSSGFLKTWDV
jgi:hypothetical protein